MFPSPTPRPPTRRRTAVLGAALTAVSALLAACGGAPPTGTGGAGGGSGGGGDDVLVGAGGGGGGTGAGGGAALSGRLWHNNWTLDYVDGTQVSALGSATPTQLVTGHLTAIPWPDGSQYVMADWDAFEERTLVTVRETSSGSTLYTWKLDGYLRGLRPSPVDKAMLLATWGEEFLSPGYAVFIDLTQLKAVDALPTADGPVHWLPDGRYLAVRSGGRVEAGAVGGTPVSVGQLNLPPDRTLGTIAVNSQGTQMALRLMTYDGTGSVDTSDIWVANVDGSGLGQVTNTKMSSYAKWSPDGQYIAFDVDTGLVCGGGFCAGSCGLWYVPASARGVLALDATNDAFRFRVIDRRGSEDVLGCELLAWTR